MLINQNQTNESITSDSVTGTSIAYREDKTPIKLQIFQNQNSSGIFPIKDFSHNSSMINATIDD